MLKKFKDWLGRDLRSTVGKWADALMDLASGKRFSRNEGRLASDAYSVKAKLGKSFFTRRLSPATRYKRIRSLTLAEKVLASQQGWLGLTDREFRKAQRLGLIA